MEKQDPKALAAKLWAAAQGTLALLKGNTDSDGIEMKENRDVSSVKHESDIELKIDSVFSMPLDAYLGQEHKTDSLESMARNGACKKENEESKCKMCMVVIENIDDYLMGRKRVFYRQWKRRFQRCGKMCRIKHINKIAEKEQRIKKEKEDIMRLKKHIHHLHETDKKDIKRLDDFRRKMLQKNITKKNELRRKKLQQRLSKKVSDSSDQQKKSQNVSNASTEIKKEKIIDDKNHQSTNVLVQSVKRDQSQVLNFDSKKVTEHRTPDFDDVKRKTNNSFQHYLPEQQGKLTSINDPASLQNVLSKFPNNSASSESSSGHTTTVEEDQTGSPSLNLKSVFSTTAKAYQTQDIKPKPENYVMMTVNGNSFLVPSSQLNSELKCLGKLAQDSQRLATNTLNQSQHNNNTAAPFHLQPVKSSVQIEPPKIPVQQNSHSVNMDTSRHLTEQTLFGKKLFQQQSSSTVLGLQQPIQNSRFSTQQVVQPLSVFQTVTPNVQTNMDHQKQAFEFVLPFGQAFLNSLNQSTNVVPSISVNNPNLNVMPLKSTLPTAGQNSVNLILSQPTSNILTTTGTLQGNIVNITGLPQIVTPQLIDSQGVLQAVTSPVQQQSQNIPMIVQQQTSPVQYIMKPDFPGGHTQPITLPSPKTVTIGNQQYMLMPTIGNINTTSSQQQVTSATVPPTNRPVNEPQGISQKNITQQSFSKTETTQRDITSAKSILDLKPDVKPNTTVSDIKQKESQAKLKNPTIWRALQTVNKGRTAGIPLVLSGKKSPTGMSTTEKSKDMLITDRAASPLSAVQHAPLHSDVSTAATLHSDVKRNLGQILKRKSIPIDADVIYIDDASEQTVMPAKKRPRKSRPEPRRELDDLLDINPPTEKSNEMNSHSTADSVNITVNSSFLPKTPTLPTGFRCWPEGATIEEKKITLPDTILQELRERPVSEWATVGQIVPNKMH